MNTNVLCLALVCLTLFTADHAHAGDPGLRCEGYLVSKGMNQAEVRALCGTPASESIYHRHVHTGLDSSPNHRDIEVTELVYDFGPRQFMRALRFEDGGLVSIESLGYGDTPQLRCEGYLVSKGMSETEVRKLCGTPALVERWHYDFTEPQGDTIIADLVYNFGSLKCSWLLRFENDRLVRVSQPETCHVHTGPVESLGYGYR